MTEQVQDIPAEKLPEQQETEQVVSFVREGQAQEEETTDELAELRQALEKTKAQSAEYLDGWQRARAELANARKRFDKERSEAGLFANAALIRKILPALDDVDRAMKTIPADLADDAWANGIALVQRKFQNVLESEGVKSIEVKPGDKFDPTWHEAVTHEDHTTHKEGEIIAEVQKGYQFGEQVLRPALVRVAK